MAGSFVPGADKIVVKLDLKNVTIAHCLGRGSKGELPRPGLAALRPKERCIRRMISFAERAIVPSNVLIRFLDQESVLLNLNTERYFGLDSVGTRMWQLVTSGPTIEVAYFQLIEE